MHKGPVCVHTQYTIIMASRRRLIGSHLSLHHNLELHSPPPSPDQTNGQQPTTTRHSWRPSPSLLLVRHMTSLPPPVNYALAADAVLGRSRASNFRQSSDGGGGNNNSITIVTATTAATRTTTTTSRGCWLPRSPHSLSISCLSPSLSLSLSLFLCGNGKREMR